MENKFEIVWWNQKKSVAGVDEAGRGALAGPVVAAAVVLDPNKPIVGLNDSKKLSHKKRTLLYQEIHEKALAVGVGIVDARAIDQMNILQATLEAMRQAINKLPRVPDHVLIDGNKSPFSNNNAISHEVIVGGDAKSMSIAAASIVAKVSRDKMMMNEIDQAYPQYGFQRHKGYGTKQHYSALRQHGSIKTLHRQSFRLF